MTKPNETSGKSAECEMNNLAERKEMPPQSDLARRFLFQNIGVLCLRHHVNIRGIFRKCNHSSRFQFIRIS